MKKKEVDEELRKIAAYAYVMDGYHVQRKKGQAEIDAFKDYYREANPEPYKKMPSDEEIELIIGEIQYMQTYKSRRRGRILLIMLIALCIYAVYFFML